jgi:hypothetical protein
MFTPFDNQSNIGGDPINSKSKDLTSSHCSNPESNLTPFHPSTLYLPTKVPGAAG